MKALLAALLLLTAAALGAPALAANADAPHKNVDKSNDAGNSTGNDQTEKLNQQQASQPATTTRPAPAQPPTPK